MAQYEQKTDSREFEVANLAQTPGAWSGEPSPAEATEIAIRIWAAEGSRLRGLSTWKTDSIVVYMISDLVVASHGRLTGEPTAMSAHFDAAGQAIVAGKRIQTAILEFLACRPGECLGAAILIFQPRAGASAGFSGEMVEQALALTKPGQILLTDDLARRLRDRSNMEFRSVPGLTSGGPGQLALMELVWASAERLDRLQSSVGDGGAQPSDPPMGATMIVDWTRRGPTSEAPPPVMATDDVALRDASEAALQRSVPDPAESNSPFSEELEESPSSSLLEELGESEERPFITRTRVLLGAAAIVVVGALLAVVYHPHPVAKPPVQPQQEQPARTESQDKSTPATLETHPSPVVTQNPQLPVNGAGAAQPAPSSPPVSNGPKKKKNNAESQDNSEPPQAGDLGGFSQKDIPALLKMAQQHLGAGNYDQARREFRKIMQLQPNNQEAKDGLRRLDLIKNDEE